MKEKLSDCKYLIKLIQATPKAPVLDRFTQNDQHIIDLIRKIPAVRPADDFTPRVMGRLAIETKERIYTRTWRFLARHHEFALNPIRALHTGMSNEERSLYFMLVAFAHLVLAVVLFLGLSRIDSETVISPFLLLQPWISLFLAVWLSFWGFLLKGNQKTGVKRARLAALVYIEIAVISGVLLLMEFKAILLLIPFFAATVGLSVAAGIFLAVTCRNENIRSNNGASVLV